MSKITRLSFFSFASLSPSKEIVGGIGVVGVLGKIPIANGLARRVKTVLMVFLRTGQKLINRPVEELDPDELSHVRADMVESRGRDLKFWFAILGQILMVNSLLSTREHLAMGVAMDREIASQDGYPKYSRYSDKLLK
jgi:hypothetical protein